MAGSSKSLSTPVCPHSLSPGKMSLGKSPKEGRTLKSHRLFCRGWSGFSGRGKRRSAQVSQSRACQGGAPFTFLFSPFAALPWSSVGRGEVGKGTQGGWTLIGWEPRTLATPKPLPQHCPPPVRSGRGLTCYLKPMTNSSLGAALSSRGPR